MYKVKVSVTSPRTVSTGPDRSGNDGKGKPAAAGWAPSALADTNAKFNGLGISALGRLGSFAQAGSMLGSSTNMVQFSSDIVPGAAPTVTSADFSLYQLGGGEGTDVDPMEAFAAELTVDPSIHERPVSSEILKLKASLGSSQKSAAKKQAKKLRKKGNAISGANADAAGGAALSIPLPDVDSFVDDAPKKKKSKKKKKKGAAAASPAGAAATPQQAQDAESDHDSESEQPPARIAEAKVANKPSSKISSKPVVASQPDVIVPVRTVVESDSTGFVPVSAVSKKKANGKSKSKSSAMAGSTAAGTASKTTGVPSAKVAKKAARSARASALQATASGRCSCRCAYAWMDAFA